MVIRVDATGGNPLSDTGKAARDAATLKKGAAALKSKAAVRQGTQAGTEKTPAENPVIPVQYATPIPGVPGLLPLLPILYQGHQRTSRQPIGWGPPFGEMSPKCPIGER